MTVPVLSIGIETLVDRGAADAEEVVEDARAREARGEMGLDQVFDRVDDFGAGDGGAEDGAERGVGLGVAAERDLVELLAILVDAEQADMADVVMAAGVD